MARRRWSDLGFCALLLLLAPGRADACAVCGAGDATLTVMGAERPFAGRLRISGELRAGTARVTPAIGPAIDVHEQRFDLGVAYAPLPTLFLSLSLPLLRREASLSNGAAITAFGLGDVEIRAKHFIWDARKGQYRHQIALQGGLKLPTAPVQRDAYGVSLPADLQPGAGAITPTLGAVYALSNGPWSLYASAAFYLPFAVREGPHSSDSLRAAITGQRQLSPAVATRVGFSTRLDAAGERDGQPDPSSGGLMGFVSTELVVSPVTDWVFLAGAYFPALQALRGGHREGTILALGATYDF
jgi:hypothetical protein